MDMHGSKGFGKPTQGSTTTPYEAQIEDASFVLATKDVAAIRSIGERYRTGIAGITDENKRYHAIRITLTALGGHKIDDKDVFELLEVCWDSPVEAIEQLYQSSTTIKPRTEINRYIAIKEALKRFYDQRPPVQKRGQTQAQTVAQVRAQKRKATAEVGHGNKISAFFQKRQKQTSALTEKISQKTYPKGPSVASTQEVTETIPGQDRNEESLGKNANEKSAAIPSTHKAPEVPLCGDRHEAPSGNEQQELEKKWLDTIGPKSLVGTWSGASYHDCSVPEKERIDKVLRVHKKWVEQESPSMSLVENIDELRQSLLNAASTLERTQMTGAGESS